MASCAYILTNHDSPYRTESKAVRSVISKDFVMGFQGGSSVVYRLFVFSVSQRPPRSHHSWMVPTPDLDLLPDLSQYPLLLCWRRNVPDSFRLSSCPPHGSRWGANVRLKYVAAALNSAYSLTRIVYGVAVGSLQVQNQRF